MSDDNIFDFTSYRGGSGNLVPCKRCKRPIPADSTRCTYCGLHYQGHAWQFTPEADGEVRMHFTWVKAIADPIADCRLRSDKPRRNSSSIG